DPASGQVAPLDKLAHFDDRRIELARLLREVYAHYLANEASKGEDANKAVLQRIVHEQAFTILNRLVALRMMEARGLLIASVARGDRSDGFQLYERVAGRGLGDTGETYRQFLLSLFDEFAEDMP